VPFLFYKGDFMIIRFVEGDGFSCGYECYNKKTKAMGICGVPAVVKASGRPGAYLCKECAQFVAGTAKAEYRIKECYTNPIDGKEIEKEKTVSSAEFWDKIKA